MLLIVGGSRDHNIRRLADAAASRNAPHRLVFTDADPAPAVTWALNDGTLYIDGEPFRPGDTALFIRYDVFGGDPARNAALYDAIKGWALAHPQVTMVNRGNESLEVSKPRALILARQCGFRIPATVITNDFAAVAHHETRIAKPVGGGAHAVPLGDAAPDGRPAIVQERLDYPELRLFRVGGHYFAFRVESATLDCRADPGIRVTEIAPPRALLAAMHRLSAALGLDYAAADFKTDPRDGAPVFLEINSMPMFTGYDDAARGRLSDALFLALSPPRPASPRPAP